MTVMTKDGIRPDIRPTLYNVTCVQGSGPFAVCDRAIFTAHAADSDSTDYRAMLKGAHSRAECEKAGGFAHCWERNAYNAALGEPL